MKKLPILFVLIAACGGVDPVETEATWSIEHETDGALLGVWGNAPDDVWAVGGNLDQSLVLHNDGTGWTRHAAPKTSLLWNAYGFSGQDVYAVGERGLILHYDGDAWTQLPSGTDVTLFGLWGASGDDVWIVGGDVGSNTAVVLRGNTRSGFAPVDLPTDPRPATLFKAHGFAPDDVLVVGRSGALRWNGSEWRREDLPTTAPLHSTWGRGADDVYAVGGGNAAEILHSDGAGWSMVAELPTGAGLSGVFTAPDQPTLTVGARSFLFEVGEDGSVIQPALPDISATPDLHGVWGDGLGTAYAVGANLSAYSVALPMHGVILRRR